MYTGITTRGADDPECMGLVWLTATREFQLQKYYQIFYIRILAEIPQKNEVTY